MKHVFRESFLPASETEIKKLEEKIGYPLPEDYKYFLSSINGGVIFKGYFKSMYNDSMDSADWFYGLDMEDQYPEEKLRNLKYAHNNMSYNEFPPSQIQIATSTMTETIMSLLPEDYGFIYCGHRELGDEHDYNEERARRTSNREELSIVGFTLYADSFTHFLENQVSEEEYNAYLDAAN